MSRALGQTLADRFDGLGIALDKLIALLGVTVMRIGGLEQNMVEMAETKI